MADKGKKARVDDVNLESELILAIEKLQEIQDELEKVNEEASDKVLEVEQKYNETRRPVYEKRNSIIQKIPDFWLTAFLSHPALCDLLTQEDQKVFKYLQSLDVEDFKDVKSGYSISFTFRPNPYFEDTKLVKVFRFSDEGTISISGSTVKWKDGMDLTNGVGPDKEGRKRPLQEESFFKWFSETQQKVPSDAMNDEVAEIVKEDLWPNPLKYFNNEADEEDYEEDDDIEDEEDDDIASAGICLEYGSATRLYCVPYVYHEEQVIVGPSQNLTQLTRLPNISNCSTLECGSRGVKASQVLLRCDSQGSLDFSNFPFRLFVVDLQNKMSKFSLYGVVTFLGRARGNSDNIFLMKIKDSTGSITIKLNFSKHWSAGTIYCGHTVFLSGLVCYLTSKGRMECLWHESNDNTSITNISQLPALLNSACLHHIYSLSELSSEKNSMQVCRVRIERVELHQLNIELSHSHCGYSVTEEPNGLPICSFCLCVCDTEVTPSFSFTVTLKDDSMKVSAYCSGQSAAELLQVFPDEFCTWPEDEQAMYLFTIENDEFIVAICKNMCNNDGRQEAHNVNPDSATTTWRITRALKCE